MIVNQEVPRLRGLQEPVQLCIAMGVCEEGVGKNKVGTDRMELKGNQ